MIKAIIFDFYGVLCSEEFWHKLKADPEIGPNFIQMGEQLHLGSLSWSDFLRQVAAQTGRKPEDILSSYAEDRINLPLVEYIHQLRSKYKVGLLSNAAYEAFEPRGKEIGFDKLFDVTVVSSQVGITKPDPRIYEYIFDKLAVKPNEAIYIDDSQRLVEAATKIGIKSIQYRNFEQLKEDLKRALSASSNN